MAGAGLALMLSCDVIVSAVSTKFLLAYADVGLTPDCGVSYLLPRAIGQQRALGLALTGRTLTAEEASAWGLINEVVDDTALSDRALRLGEQLAAGPAFALGRTKQLMRTCWNISRGQRGREEAQVIAEAVKTADAATVIDSFLHR
ncbi:enoyl-CoA hydratase/isomerase family protein [Streptomyces asiaticus]